MYKITVLLPKTYKMQLKFILALFCFSIFSQSQSSIETKKVENIITKHGLTFNDEYSWLEKMDSDETKSWVSRQNAYAEGYYAAVKKSVSTKETIKIYDQNSTGSLPSIRGRYFYKLLTVDNKKSPYLFMLKKLDEEPIELVNPNKIYKNKNVNIENYYPSKNSNYLAYSLRIDGSDKLEIRFLDINRKEKLKDTLINVKFSNVSWNKDLGVFYKLNSNKNQFEKDSTYHVFYHRMNTTQDKDELVYDGTKSNKDVQFFTSKSNFFLIEKDNESNKKSYYYSNLDDQNFTLTKFYESANGEFRFINYHAGRIYYSTDKYNWGEVRYFNLKNKSDDKQIIPQFYNHLLVNTSFTDNYLFCKYKTLGKTYLSVYDYEGKFIKKIETPIGSNISFQNFDEETKDIYFTVSSYTIPNRNFRVNLLNSKDPEQVFTSVNRAKPTVFPLDYFETKCISFKNRENIDVPITIIYKKGLQLNGNNPCLLEAYGGFGTISGPRYDNGLLHFLDKGGVYAFAEIRGGGEKGKDWHKKGIGLNRKNGLDDFIDASEFLIQEKYTNQNKLAITGGSQGGLVVGYALTERPDLYKLALPKVGVFDMVKFDKFTIGNFHHTEYGNPEIETEFKSILSYSPLHKIKKDVNYPMTVIFTADNDDRVPPLHSYKFAAALQNREAQKNRIILITKKELGHYGGNTYNKFVEEKAQFYDFLIRVLIKE
ncbi:prolyl oligopeptidase family serine peptidase [Flavobacterium hankyongi]|uniref:prolyl oligopeptidase n=2 Tax=Flavobacteriaceae TaxID=49546 RepID=A0ABP8ZPM0_9FLAO